MNCLLWLLPQLRLRELSVLWPLWWVSVGHDALLVAPFSLSLAKSQPEKGEATSDNESTCSSPTRIGRSGSREFSKASRNFPRALEPFLPLRQQFATRNNEHGARELSNLLA